MMRAFHEDEDFDEEEDVEERTSQIVGELDVNMEDMYGEYEESGQGDDDEDEENDDDEDENEDSDEDEDEDDTEDAGGDEDEDEDVEMANGDEVPPTSPPDATSPSTLPPHLARRRLFIPSFLDSRPPTSLTIEAICAIPLPSPVHSLAATPCMSYLLTGSQEGYIRAYDFWSSVNGGQMMTAQQRSAVGFGEGVSKAGVARGWWENDVTGSDGEGRAEPVYSMSVESDGLWALTGTRSGQINLYTLRHSPGHFITALKGHSSVVSCMTLLPNEKGFISGGWDGTLREWDLNTGQTVRTYPTHGAQISSLSLQPYGPTPTAQANGNGNGLNVSVRVGEDFFNAKEDLPPSSPPASSTPRAPPQSSPTDKPNGSSATAVDRDSSAIEPATTTATDAPSPYDPLFDDDAEGEEVPPSDGLMGETPGINDMAPPSPPSKGISLALPGTSKLDGIQIPSSAPPTSSLFPQAGPSRPNVESAAAGAGIPILSPTEYKSFSNNVLMYSSMDGQVTLVDRRVPEVDGEGQGSRRGVGRLVASDKAPPWCMSACWSGHGNHILAGRRNGTVDIWDVRKSSSSHTPNLLRTLKTPAESGPVSCIVPFPDGRHVATASNDNIRLWNTVEYFDSGDEGRKRGGKPPFKIIAGHHGGTISSMIVDPTCRFLITASGDRGWQGESTKVVLIHEVKW